MAITRTRGRPPKNPNIGQEEEEETQNESNNGGTTSEYEQFREQRIKENLERMEKMGILDLSRKLKSDFLPPPPKRRKPSQNKVALAPSTSPRRSSRLNTMTRVNYSERVPIPKNEAVSKPLKEKKLEGNARVPKPKKERRKLVGNVEIHIKEGSKPEIYTEEHEQLLGDSKTTWILDVDGYDEDGQRIYDQFEGKHCHQCRLKTLGRHTECSNCKVVEGQFCGDCLFTRYGENVIEANENLSWTCPVCRGICNCSRCRRENGWEPTGSIYWKVEKLGFKSVAHYLIQTKRSQKIQEDPTGENGNHAKGSLPLADGESKPTDGIEEIKADSEHVMSNGDHEDCDAIDDHALSEEEGEEDTK